MRAPAEVPAARRLALVASVEGTEALLDEGQPAVFQVADPAADVRMQSWPACDEALLARQTVTVVVQINGKTKGRFEMDAADAVDQAKVEECAMQSDAGTKHLQGKTPSRVIVAPNAKLVNFVLPKKPKKK